LTPQLKTRLTVAAVTVSVSTLALLAYPRASADRASVSAVVGTASDEVLVDFAAREALPSLVSAAVTNCKVRSAGSLEAMVLFETNASGLMVRSVVPHVNDAGLSLVDQQCIAAAMANKSFKGTVDGGIPDGRTYELDIELPIARRLKLD
jgi:hypothetical protein